MSTDLLDWQYCVLRPARNVMLSTYVLGGALQTTVLLTLMEVKQLNQWNKLLYIIPN